jgi:hypothetical protein
MQAEPKLCARAGCTNRVKRSRNGFCSRACTAPIRIPMACTVCGKPHTRTTRRVRRKTCSPACARISFSVAHSKPKRICARPGCGQPLKWRSAQCCSRDCSDILQHGRKRRVAPSRKLVREAVTPPDELHRRMPARLIPLLEQLPAAERAKAIEGWRHAA